MNDFRTLVKEIRNDPAPLDAYEGRSLGQAFWKLMFGDHRFYEAQDLAQGREICGMKCNASNTGPKWPSRSGLWPAQPGPLDLVMGWLDPDVMAYGVECEPDGNTILQPWVTDDFDKLSTIWDAARVVEALLDRFLAPLRDGRVVASGHAASDDRPLGPISPAVWSRPATRFDAINSGVARWTGWAVDQSAFSLRAKRFRFEVIAPEFEAVSLDLAAAKGSEKPAGGMPGRPRQYSYVKGMSAVLSDILIDGLPINGAALSKMLEKQLIKIDGRSPELRRLEQDISKRDETLWQAVVSRPSK